MARFVRFSLDRGRPETADDMTALGNAARSLSVTLLATVCMGVLGLCSGIIVARTLPVADRGELATLIVWPSTLAVLGDLGISFALSYFIKRDGVPFNALWTIAWCAGAVWGALLALCGFLLMPQLLGLSSSTAAILAWTLASIPASLLCGYFSFCLLGSNLLWDYNIVRVAVAGSYTLGVAFFAAVKSPSVEVFGYCYVASQYLGATCAYAFCVRRWAPAIQWPTGFLRPVIGYGSKIYVSALAAQLNSRLDQLVLSSRLPFQQLGTYVVGTAFSTMLSPMFSAFAVVVLPRVSACANPRHGGIIAAGFVRTAILVGLPLVLVIEAAVPAVLPILFGERYAAAVTVARILLVTAFVQGLNAIISNSLRALGKPGAAAIAEIGGVIVISVVLFLTLDQWGAIGAAVAVLAGSVQVMVMNLIFLSRCTEVSWRRFLIFSRDDFSCGWRRVRSVWERAT